jgi:L-rhamnose isomerase
MLRALLEPKELISKYELAGEGYKVLALIEEQKAMPWQAVYDMFCLKNGVAVGDAFIAEIEKYVAEVTSKR